MKGLLAAENKYNNEHSNGVWTDELELEPESIKSVEYYNGLNAYSKHRVSIVERNYD